MSVIGAALGKRVLVPAVSVWGGGSGTARESLTSSVWEVSLTFTSLEMSCSTDFPARNWFKVFPGNLVSQNNIVILFPWKFQNPHKSKTRKYTTENTVESIPVWAGRWTAGLNELFGTAATSKKSDEMLIFRAGSVILVLDQFGVFI